MSEETNVVEEIEVVNDAAVVSEIEVVEVVETPVIPVKRRKVPAGTIRRLVNSSRKARAALEEKPTTEPILKEVTAGIKKVKKLAGTEDKGKFSPLGHKAGFQNGALDKAILSCEVADFGEWVKAVAKAECKSRRSDPTDNKALINRLYSHTGTLCGVTKAKANTFRLRLANVGLESQADEIMSAFTPLNVWFKEHMSVGKF